MKTTTHNQYHCEIFDSLGEFITKARSNPKPEASNKADNDGWSQTPSLEAACDLAHTGWTDVRPEVDAVLGDLQDRLAMRLGDRYVTVHNVTGGGVDVGRYLSGHPACMVQFVNEPAEAMGRVVKIAVAGTASHHIPSESIRRRGVAVLALVDTLHKLGVGIELWWDSSVEGDNVGGTKNYTTMVKLHDSMEPMDIDSIMFALAHPSMLRRLTFSVQEQSPTKTAQHAFGYGGYGVPTSMGAVQVDDFDVVVERLQSGYGDIVADPFGWVMSTVTGLGIVEGGE